MGRVAAILFAGWALIPTGCGQPIPAPVPAPAAGGPAVDIGDGSVVLAAFRTDPIAAGQAWIGERVRVSAAVAQVDPNEGEPYIELAGRILVVPVQTESAAFGRLTTGAVVTVEGTILAPTTGVPPLTLVAAVLIPVGQ